MKKQDLDRLIKLKEAELNDLLIEQEQVAALEEVLASKPLTSKAEVDERIRSKVIDLLLENFHFTPLHVRDDEPISEDVVVLDDESVDIEAKEEKPKKAKRLKKATPTTKELRAQAKAKAKAEAQKEKIDGSDQNSLTLLEDGQSLDDLVVEDGDDSDEDDIESGVATRSLQKAPPQGQGQPQVPNASFYTQAADGAFDSDAIPAEYQHRVRAKRTDDGDTSGSIRRKS